MNFLSWQTWSQWAQDDDAKTWLDSHKLSLFGQFRELEALSETPQDPDLHPEGDVWVHTTLVCHEAAHIAKRENLPADYRHVLMLAALCHDLGKPTTTENIQGRWRSPRHCQEGYHVSLNFLTKIKCPDPYIQWILPLVKEHLFFASMETISEKAVRRLINRLEGTPYQLLALLVEADKGGRPPLPKGRPKLVDEVFHYLPLPVEKSRTSGLIGGKDILERGIKPGPIFSFILDACFKAQEDQKFANRDEALRYLDRHWQDMVDKFHKKSKFDIDRL